MPLEELLVDGDILDGDDPGARLVLDHTVDEQRGIAITEPVEQPGNVERHDP